MKINVVEWNPEQGEEIMVWDENEADAVKREFVAMSKNGNLFYCHHYTGYTIVPWPYAKRMV